MGRTYGTVGIDQGFLTGVPVALGGRRHQSKGYEMRHQNSRYFKLFAKNLVSMLLEMRKTFSEAFFNICISE